MRRIPLRPALALLGVLLCFTACQLATVQKPVVPSTATAAPAPPGTPSVASAPTPTHVPAGWVVLAGVHFHLAYPANWNVRMPRPDVLPPMYVLMPPTPDGPGVRVTVYQLSGYEGSNAMAPYCLPATQTGGVEHVTLDGLPMAYEFGTGEGAGMRTWTFVNAQRTQYVLDALDAQGTPTAQAQDDGVLATFSPDDSTPWQC